MTDTTAATELDPQTLALMQAWGTIATKADDRSKGARFGGILATYDPATGTIASPRAVERTGVASKSTVSREGNVALAVAAALGDNLPTPSAGHADTLAIFSKLASALAKVSATHRAGILERLGAHADGLADLSKRADALLAEAVEARESESRGARPEGNASHGETDEPAESPADEPAGPRPLSSILGELAAHLNGLPAEDLADALDEVSALVDQVSARIFS